MVCRNLLIGNQFAAEDSPYLALNGVTHVVNTAGTVSEPDCVRPNREHLTNLGIQLLNLEVRVYLVMIIHKDSPSFSWSESEIAVRHNGKGGKFK